MTQQIQLSDHFGYRRLIRFTMPSILMMIFTSIYGVVDGFFVSNFVGKNPFAAVNFILDMTAHAFTVYAFSFLFAGSSIFGSAFFTALNDGLTSALISFLRTLLFQGAAVMILPLIWGLDGIWYSIVVAELMAVAVTITFLVIKHKKYRYW